MAAETSAPAGGQGGPSHAIRLAVMWIAGSVIGDILIWFVLGPHLPPGRMSTSAVEEQGAIKLMSVLCAPVLVFVVVYFLYAIIVFRQREGDDTDGPPIHGHSGVQTLWIAGTSVIVLSLAAFGTVSLITSHGAGAGEGPAPIWMPPGATALASQQTATWTPGQTPLQVQVIGQQWKFTYRYPQFGGMETTELVIPEGQWVQFNVTSIDVIHSFWAYQLGVKADANPGVNNVAFTKAEHTGTFIVRCAELCGLWHGAMYNNGSVVSLAQFQSWTSAQSTQLASVTKLLPAYDTTYDSTAIKTLGNVLVKLGLSGAGGGYYPSADPAQP